MIRKAKIGDVKEIQKIINHYAEKKEMLPRALNELYENLQSFFVVEKKKKVVGCCALYITWEDLAEIKSLAVSNKYTKMDYGKLLVKKCLKEAEKLGVKKVFALTYIPDFFKKFGFKVIPREKLPHKIWSECIKCHLFPDCDETPVLKEL